MPRAKSSAVLPSSIALLSEDLSSLPERPKETYSLREAISKLSQPISTALDRGYSYEEIAGILKDNGIAISTSSLKSYVTQNKKNQGVKQRRSRKAKVEPTALTEAEVSAIPRSSEVESPSTVSVPAEQAEAAEISAPAAPKRRGRRATAQEKTAAKTKPASKRTTATTGRGSKKK